MRCIGRLSLYLYFIPFLMHRLFFVFWFVFAALLINAQCINVFPYSEDFELNNGNWTSGGTGNDWAWGAPTKPVINSAFSGNKCWITGGLTASFYALGARSYVQSPCFDFTNLQYPYIQFAIFWETEKTYDGATFQYSLNGGSTWTNVGSITDPANCMNANWFNTPSVTYLTTLANPKDGWSGNVQSTSGSCQGGSGSNGWKIAKHCISNLAGEPNVIFRFAFGAGTQCNAYDGLAFDDIYIGEAPAISATVSYNCVNSNTVSLTATTTQCPTNLQWNFGDGQTATGNTASHTYASPGIYNITFAAAGPCNAPASASQTVEILNLQTGKVDVSCPGASNGIVFVSNSSAAVSYVWSSTPQQTNDTAYQLTAGTYTVTATGANACSATATATVNSSNQGLVLSAQPIPDTCGQQKGSVMVNASGDIAPYTYIWNTGASTATLLNVATGTYTVSVISANNCSASASAFVPNTSVSFTANFQSIPDTCSQQKGGASVIVNGANGPYGYLWSNGATTAALSNVSSGSYSVTVDDAFGCSSTTSGVVGNVANLVLSLTAKPDTCSQQTGSVLVNVFNGNAPYSFAWNTGTSTNPLVGLTAGNYSVSTTDAAGCSASASTTLTNTSGIGIYVAEKIDVSCYGTSDGRVVVGVNGENAPFSYLWSNSSTDSMLSNVVKGEYSLTVTNAAGCTDSTTINIGKIDCESYIYFPTAFSPNGDGTNDFFRPKYSIDLTDYWLEVYNRWGERIFVSTMANEGWDGTYKYTPQPLEVYTYQCRYKFKDGDWQNLKGNFTLLR